jgi:hypothetical protein
LSIGHVMTWISVLIWGDGLERVFRSGSEVWKCSGM